MLSYETGEILGGGKTQTLVMLFEDLTRSFLICEPDPMGDINKLDPLQKKDLTTQPIYPHCAVTTHTQMDTLPA